MKTCKEDLRCRVKRMKKNDKFLSIKEAAELLGVSRPTFNVIRKQGSLREYPLGKKVRFLESDILRLAKPSSADKMDLEEQVDQNIRLDILSNNSINDLEVKPNVFDLRRIQFIDTYGILSLLSTILVPTKDGKHVELIVDDNSLCKNLHSLGFFYEIESACKELVSWDKSLLRGPAFSDQSTLLPMRIVKYKGEERRLLEKLLSLLVTQGFSSDIGAYIGWIMGELADNSLTHSGDYCYLLARRYEYGNSKCIIIGIADTGVGIYNSLKTNNKYKDLDNPTALLTAFKSKFSSWDDNYNRGKGLTDVLKIAMGNNTFLRVDSAEHGFFLDFTNEDNFFIKAKKPIANVRGTRFGLVLIDQKFELFEREDIDVFIDKELGKL